MLEQNPSHLELEQGPSPPTPMSSASLWSAENFSQRVSVIGEVRRCRNQGKQSRPNNTN